jgi:hypothetical protein
MQLAELHLPRRNLGRDDITMTSQSNETIRGNQGNHSKLADKGIGLLVLLISAAALCAILYLIPD